MSNKIQQAFGQIHATDQMKYAAALGVLEREPQRLRPAVRFRKVWRPLVLACLLLFSGAGFGGWYLLETPVSYVSVDVNPSIELTLNRLNRVTGAESRNEAGEMILKEVQVKGRSYLDAVRLLVESDVMQRFLTEDADLIFTVASPRADELLTGLESSEVSILYQGMCRQADMETVASAHECGMSLGKYTIYKRLSEYDASVTAEECQHISMHQLHLRLSQYEGGNDEYHKCDDTGSAEDGCAEGRHHCQETHR